MRRILLVVMLALVVPACARHRVATQPDLPPLAPPPPPPRVVTPADVTEPDTSGAPQSGAGTEADRKAPRTNRRAPGTTTTAKPKPAEPAPPPKAETPPPPTEQPPPAKPAPTLQTGGQPDMERQARQLIQQARADLKQVKPHLLNQDGHTQFQAANRFVDQAEQAYKDKNYVLALSLADKAATIAAVLLGK